MANRTFVGFSTINDSATTKRTWALYDIDLIKRDLLNHFHTRKGERVMRPTFGCTIWDKLMEPMSAGLRQEIVEETYRICSLDTRIAVKDVNVRHNDHQIIVSMDLIYIPFQSVENFQISFDRRQQEF